MSFCMSFARGVSDRGRARIVRYSGFNSTIVRLATTKRLYARMRSTVFVWLYVSYIDIYALT